MKGEVASAIQDSRLTDPELAQLVGVIPKTVKRWRDAECMPQHKNLAKLARHLGREDLWPPDLTERDFEWFVRAHLVAVALNLRTLLVASNVEPVLAETVIEAVRRRASAV